MDKTGACTVIAAIATVARLAPGHAAAGASRRRSRTCPARTRPGPATSSRALNGKKVDITNTDAEGRLILGDAMTYAERLGATHLVDVATLTGAVVAGARPPRDRRRSGRRRPFYDEVVAAARPGRRALLAAPAHRRLRARDGQLVRRPPELRLGRGLARQERPVPARVRDRAVGPPRHRRHRPTSARPLPFAPRGATGVSHATLVELALAGAHGRLSRPRRRRRPIADRDRDAAGAARGRPRRRRAASSASPPTGSRRAGPSTTRSIPAGRPSTGGRSSVALVGALAFGLLPAAVRRRPARVRRSSGRGS